MGSTDGDNDVVETEKRPAEAGDATEPASKRPNTEEEPKPGDAVDPKTLSHLTNPTRHDYFINKVNQLLIEYAQIKEKCKEELESVKYQLRNAMEANFEDVDNKFAELISGFDNEVAKLVELFKTGSADVGKLEEALKKFSQTLAHSSTHFLPH